MNTPNKKRYDNVSVSGLALPAPGTVLAVFEDGDGGEFTAPVLALFARVDTSTEYGQFVLLDGFTAGGEVGDQCPLSEFQNFRCFRFAGAADARQNSRESGICRHCGNRAETDETHGACAACLAANNLALAIQDVREAKV